MILIAFISLGLVSLLMGILNCLFDNKEDWKGVVVRALTMLSYVVFALVTTNLKVTINALSLFVTIAIVLSLIRMLELSNKIEKEKTRLIYKGIIDILVIASFAVSTLSLSTFNYFAAGGGLLLGIALGLLVWAIKRGESLTKSLLSLFKYTFVGILIGFAISGLFTSNHLVSAIIVMIASVVILSREIVQEFLKESKSKQILINLFEMLTIICFIVSIYFY